MITQETIKKIEQTGREKNWSYPQLFEALRAAGVERYETDVLTYNITYVGGGTSLIFPAPEGFTPLTLGPRFDEEALKLALGRVQRKETNYIQFLAEIAAAGVPFYRVDMKPRTVTYHGQNRKDKLVETIPQI